MLRAFRMLMAVSMALAPPRIRRLLVVRVQVCVSPGHLCRSVPQKFSDCMQIHASHDQSTGECVAIAMPGVILRRVRKTASDISLNDGGF